MAKTQWNRAFDDFDAKTSHLNLSDGTGQYFSLRAIAISQFQRTRHLQQKHSFQNQCKKHSTTEKSSIKDLLDKREKLEFSIQATFEAEIE